MKKSLWVFLFTDINCPGDGTCSSQGTCDDATGICTCNEGFTGIDCTLKVPGKNELIRKLIKCCLARMTKGCVIL